VGGGAAAAVEDAVRALLAGPAVTNIDNPLLLTVLEWAMGSTAREGARFALHRVLLSGKKGQVVATDGLQLLIEGGFTFPWKNDLLIPRMAVRLDTDKAARRRFFSRTANST
jgi:hypothetical protein